MAEFNRFESVSGTYVEEILGQSRIGFSISDTIDFYDMVEMSKKGVYKGSTISFYDYYNGKIYTPFQKQKNVLYGKPVYLKECFWFLEGDYNKEKITLFKYSPNQEPENVTQLNMSDVDPYNLSIIGEKIHIVSESDNFTCYYPEKFKFSMDSHESVLMISDGKVYISAWVEEGWDDENNCQTEEYQYYEKVIVRDFTGKMLSEEIGCLNRRADGTWWIS